MSPRSAAKSVVVVGGGPAGVRAAERFVRAGLRPVLIDEAPRIGGQIYRQPAPALGRSLRERYGFEAAKALSLFSSFEAIEPHVDYRPGTLVWHIEDHRLHLLCGAEASVLPFDVLLLATGATERILPLPGWTLPGVVTLGAAQIALKAHASLLGPRIVLAGSGPLLYLVAWQYVKAGGQVRAVLDTAPPDARRRAWPGMLARPSVAAKGAWLLGRLRMSGVPVHRGVTLEQVDGGDRVRAIAWRAAERREVTVCDAVAIGHGLRSETQLAELAGCTFGFDTVDQAWLPTLDEAGRSSVPGVYLAGDGASILGADAAELSGARAALAALTDLGHPLRAGEIQRLDHRVKAQRRFRAALELLAPLPPDWAREAPDDLVVCRCEEVTAGDLRACARETGAQELNRLKALSRVGMGRCQGRMCAPAAARLLADAVGCELQAVGRLRGQPPVKPVPVSVLADASSASLTVPSGERDD